MEGKQMKLLLAGALLISAAQASAEPLWNDIEAGMTRAQVEALYPSRARGTPRSARDGWHSRNDSEIRAALTPDCGAKVLILYNREGRVTEVQLSNSLRPPSCTADLIQAGLLARYGEPLQSGTTSESVNNSLNAFRPSYISVGYQTSTWVKDGVSVTLRIEGGDGANWSVRYVSVADAGTLPL